MINCQENLRELMSLARSYNVSLSEEQCRLMLQHLDLLVETNQRMNLTRITEPHDALVRHVLDSLLLVPSIKSLGIPEGSRMLDIGTGGGFPGVPLVIACGCEGMLIDSVGKKSKAVNEFLHTLGLNDSVEAKAIRAEELALQQRESFDMVVARAVAQLGALIEYAAPLLKKNGYLVVSKANITDEELSAGIETGQIVGLDNVSRETYELPNNTGHREILSFKKVRKSKVKLPRQSGFAVHKPLVS